MRLRSGRTIGATAPARRRRVRARRAPTGAVARVARTVARREIRRGTELKRSYRASTAAASPAAIVIQHAIGGAIAKGDDIGTRTGASINLKSIHMRLRLVNNNATLAGGTGWFRFCVLRRMHPDGGVLQIWKPYSNTETGDAYVTTGNVDQITRPFNEARFKVLMDKKIRILPADLNSSGRYFTMKKYRLKLNKKLRFGTDVATDADVLPNIIIIGFVQWDNSSTVNTITYALDYWQYFTDN